MDNRCWLQELLAARFLRFAVTPSKIAIQTVLLVLGLCAVVALWQAIKMLMAPRTWEHNSDGQGDGDGSFDGDGGD